MLTKVTCPDKQFLLIAFPFKDPMNPIFHYTIDMKKGFSPFQNKEISETCSKDEKEKPSKISPTKPKKKKKYPVKIEYLILDFHWVFFFLGGQLRQQQ